MNRKRPSKKTTDSPRLSIEQKIDLCNYAESMPNLTPEKLAVWATEEYKLPVTRAIVRYTLSKRSELRQLAASFAHQKNLRSKALLDFDAQLLLLIDDYEEVGAVTGEIIVGLANHLADELGLQPPQRPSFSHGWLHKFQRRNDLKFRKRSGEAGSADMEAVCAATIALQDLIAQYDLKDVYNMDETGLYWHQDPRGSISRRALPGRKQSKDRLTVAIATNANGSRKLPLLVVGTAACPVDLRGYDVGEELDIDSTNTGKCWMSSELYCDWLATLDEQMRKEGRQILLLVDNVSSHDDSEILLTNVTIKHLPLNTTSVLRPMDQGIIASLKRRYMKHKTAATLRQFLAKEEIKKIKMFEALSWCAEAWKSVTAETIKNCWIHSGIVSRKRELSQLL